MSGSCYLEREASHIILEPTNSLPEASEVVIDDVINSSCKKLKLANSNPMDNIKIPEKCVPELGGSHEYEVERSPIASVLVSHKHNLDASDSLHGVTDNEGGGALQDKGKDVYEIPLKQACYSIGSSVKTSHGWDNWKPFEKDLYLKGLEIFGRNRYGISGFL